MIKTKKSQKMVDQEDDFRNLNIITFILQKYLKQPTDGKAKQNIDVLVGSLVGGGFPEEAGQHLGPHAEGKTEGEPYLVHGHVRVGGRPVLGLFWYNFQVKKIRINAFMYLTLIMNACIFFSLVFLIDENI